MSRLVLKPFVQQKPKKAKKDSSYLGRVAALPCIICDMHGLPQNSRTTVHHSIHGRYGNLKKSDSNTLPLCDGHHQGMFDTTKVAVHREPARWKRLYGFDYDYIEQVRERAGHEGEDK